MLVQTLAWAIRSGRQPLVLTLQHRYVLRYVRNDRAADTCVGGPGRTSESALRAEAWAGEPFLHEGEDPSSCSRPAPPGAARSTTR